MTIKPALVCTFVFSCGLLEVEAFSPHAIVCPSKSMNPTGRQFSPLCARSCSRMTQDDDCASSTASVAMKGSWGSWTKQVSQSEEQERILRKISESEGQSELLFRTGTKDDTFGITRLCVDTFRGPFEWWMLPIQLFQEFAFLGQINARLGLVKRNEIKHGMVVVEDTTSRGLVGFLEIGMLPPPTTSEESVLVDGAKSGGVETISDGATEGATGEDHDAGPIMGKPADAVYLANVVVDRSRRGRGIGRKMVASALEVVKQLWPDEKVIYVTVEKLDNGAIYDFLGSNAGSSLLPVLTHSQVIYEMGSFVLAVRFPLTDLNRYSKDNDVAFALYESIGFERAAVEDDMLARRRRRKPRVYLRKNLA